MLYQTFNENLEKGVWYVLCCCLAWVVVLAAVRVLVLGKSSKVPVFRITPDRREAREHMVTCEWLQTVITKMFDMAVGDIPAEQLRETICEHVNTFMHLGGGKFELFSLNLGSSPPQVCGVEARREGADRIVLIADLFYEGDFTASFGLEHPVQLPLLGTSMFPMRGDVESVSVQLRLRVVWDTSEHRQHPSEPRKTKCLHPPPASKSVFEISLANVPDISIKVHTEIGARHVITDSQVITSLIASLAARWLGQKLIYPQKIISRMSLPSISVPFPDSPLIDETLDPTDAWNATMAQGTPPQHNRARSRQPSDRGDVQPKPASSRAETHARTPPTSTPGSPLDSHAPSEVGVGWGEPHTAPRHHHAKMNILRSHTGGLDSVDPLLPVGKGGSGEAEDGVDTVTASQNGLCSTPSTPLRMYAQ